MPVLSMEILSEEIEKVARTAVRKYGVSFEDHVQDLWVWMIKKQPEHLGTARAQLTNYSTDLCRKFAKTTGGLKSTDFDDPEGQMFVESEKSDESDSYNRFDSPEDMVTVESIINMLQIGSKERIFVVCKAYLIEGFDFLYDEYEEYFNNLSDDDKDKIDNATRYTDDLISKVFLGFKTGTNSGSMRTIKHNLVNWKNSFC